MKAVRLGNAVCVIMGQAPSSKDCNFDANGTPFVKVGEFGISRPIIREWTTNPLRMAARTDILLCVVGATCGKINLGENCAIGRSVAAIRPNTEVLDQMYLYYFMQTLVETLRTGAVGAAQTVISKEMINEVLIPLPPLPEQHRIVAILDEAFDAIATAKANTEQNLRNARALFESYLEGVFSQRGDGWVDRTLDEVCVVERGSSPRPIKEYFTTSPDGVNWIKISDTEEGGKYVFSTAQKITAEGAKQSRLVKEGDFILTNSMSYGRPYIMKTSGYIHDGWFVLRLSSALDTDYFYDLLSSRLVQNQFMSLASGSVVKNISGDLVKRTVLPIPPLEQQRVIVEKVETIRAETQRLESLYQQKLTALDELKKSLLNQAFSGNLPNTNPPPPGDTP